MNKLVAAVFFCFGIMAVMSAFAWAAFDYQWWYGMSGEKSGREFALALFHVFAMFGGLIGMATLLAKE